MKICTRCREKYTGEEISEWKTEHEAFSMNPFMCPDCYDTFSKQDLEEQFSELMDEKAVIQ